MRFLLLFFVVLNLNAQPTPDWALIERAHVALADRELADALKLFREARNLRDVFPEAEWGIGLVYEAEQNFPLALRQYERALENSWALEFPGKAVHIQYHRARVHWLMEDFIRYEQSLREIVNIQTEELEWILTNGRRVLLTSGVDRMLTLFRLDQDASFLAYRELGSYLLVHGRDSALDYLLLAFLQAATPMVSYLQKIDPLYEFQNLDILLDDIHEAEGQEFVESVQLYQISYYLALAIRNFDFSSPSSQELLVFLSNRNDSGRWALLAREQLEQAFTPTLIEYFPDFSLPLL